MQRYTYHVGFQTGNQVEIIDFNKIPDYKKLTRIYGNSLKGLDVFASAFDNQDQLLKALESMGLTNGAGNLKLFLRDNNSKGLKVREVREGLFYKDAWQYLSREKIIEFIKTNISDPEFINAAIGFFGVYFGAKDMPEINADTDEKQLEKASKRINPLNSQLVILENYLKMLNFTYVTTSQRVINKNKASLKLASEKAIIIMVDHLAYKKSRNGGPLIEESYRGLRDVALFCSHTKEVINEKKKSGKGRRKEEKDFRNQKFLDDIAALEESMNSASQEGFLSELEIYNREHDTCLTAEEFEGKRGY